MLTLGGNTDQDSGKTIQHAENRMDCIVSINYIKKTSWRLPEEANMQVSCINRKHRLYGFVMTVNHINSSSLRPEIKI